MPQQRTGKNDILQCYSVIPEKRQGVYQIKLFHETRTIKLHRGKSNSNIAEIKILPLTLLKLLLPIIVIIVIIINLQFFFILSRMI